MPPASARALPTPPAEPAAPNAGSPAIRRALDYLERPELVFPTLPAATAEIVALANAREANFRDVDRLVRRDPVLAARVLSVANSPLYRPPAPITSLRLAMLRLGWQILREILLQATAEAHVFRGGPRREMLESRLHAVALGHVHGHVARVIGLDAEHAFACGLLHDLGRPMLLAALARPSAPPLDADERALVVDLMHTSVGERVARSWNLPEVVQRVCRDHHLASDDVSVSAVGPCTITLCEALLASLGAAPEPPPGVLPDASLGARLGLSDAELQALRESTEQLCREIQ
ncbi:MAG TPA: HDOD domain-containing protein [Nannocystaceae bacterium]|nr:HDOD domain-containing protein [Nannocystaceae bacterium]